MKMQGDIRVKSKPGRGSNFIVAFPARVAEEVTAVASLSGGEDTIPGADSLQGKSYLLLDDVAENTFILAELLKRFGVRTTVSQSGPDALALYKARPADFDAVLTDLRMPIMSGQSFIQELRSFERDRMRGISRVPIVVMTAESAVEERRLCLTQYGADEFLLKPVKLRDLILALVRLHSTTRQGKGKRKRILIVDDDVVGSRFLLGMLAKEGYKCQQAFSVGEGVLGLTEDDFDLVILDSILRDGTGPDFVRQAKSRLGEIGTKVISVSGNAVDDQRRQYEPECHIDGYLQKPVRKQDLISLVQIL